MVSVVGLLSGLAAGCDRATPAPPETPGFDEEAEASTDANLDEQSGSTASGIPDGCSDPDDCAAKGGAALASGDGPTALAMLDYACTESPPRGCRDLSTALRNGGVTTDPIAAHLAASRGCEYGDAAACVDLGVDESMGLGGATQDFEAAHVHFGEACAANQAVGCRYVGVLWHEGQIAPGADPVQALSYFAKGCELDDGPSCFNAGVEIVTTRDDANALAEAQLFMTRACELDDADGCSAAEQIADKIAEASARVPGANLRIGSATVDGLTVNSLECRVSGGGGGLLGNMVLLGAIAKRKSSIDKCGKKGTEVEVHWIASSGKITTADGEGSEGACVAKVLQKLSTPVDGECAATIVLGS